MSLPQQPGQPQHKKLTFDPTINAGHVLTFVTLVVAGFASWSLLDKRLTVVEQAQIFQRERDMKQDEVMAGKFVDISSKLDKIDRNVDEMRRDQMQQQRTRP